MTLSEFKAWFEGFTEEMEGPPNAKQWGRIQAKIKKIDGVAVTRTVFLSDYYPSRRRWDDRPLIALGASEPRATLNAGSCRGNVGRAAFASERSSAGDGVKVLEAFEPHAAMLALGKAEAAALDAA